MDESNASQRGFATNLLSLASTKELSGVAETYACFRCSASKFTGMEASDEILYTNFKDCLTKDVTRLNGDYVECICTVRLGEFDRELNVYHLWKNLLRKVDDELSQTEQAVMDVADTDAVLVDDVQQGIVLNEIYACFGCLKSKFTRMEASDETFFSNFKECLTEDSIRLNVECICGVKLGQYDRERDVYQISKNLLKKQDDEAAQDEEAVMDVADEIP